MTSYDFVITFSDFYPVPSRRKYFGNAAANWISKQHIYMLINQIILAKMILVSIEAALAIIPLPGRRAREKKKRQLAEFQVQR